MKVYIIHSPSIDRYYIGSTTEELAKRLMAHNSGKYGSKSFTSRAKDWELYYSIDCVSKSQALKIEQHIKRMKSRKYIENLKTYDEIGTKLKSMYI